jgi:hypothetical protein
MRIDGGETSVMLRLTGSLIPTVNKTIFDGILKCPFFLNPMFFLFFWIFYWIPMGFADLQICIIVCMLFFSNFPLVCQSSVEQFQIVFEH